MHAIPWAVGLFALVLSAAADLKHRIIPNELVVLVAASGLALSLGSRPEEAWINLLAAALVFFGLGLFAHYELIGGGDVKLISAATLLVPPAQIGLLLSQIAIAGGVLGCLYLTARHALKRVPVPQSDRAEIGHSGSGLARLVRNERARIIAGEPMPYALAVSGGVASYLIRELAQCFSAMSSLL